MSVIWLTKDELYPVAAKNVKPASVILDIGCGIQPQNHIVPKVHICCEPYDEYVEILQQQTSNASDRNYVLLKATWNEAVDLFPSKSVDTVFLDDVIEHLEKDQALKLLKKTEQIARSQIVVITPLGFLPQEHPDGKDAWGLNGGAWQEHKSGWQPEDFDDTWDIFVAQNYHFFDNMGKPFEKPFGAMWAIKNLDRIKFSILVPTYNHAKYLPAALDSLLNQTYPYWEAIVINDGSTDNTPEVLKKYVSIDERFKIVNKENFGVASALNEGLKHVTGEWICWLSSDDLFEPDKLEIHHSAIMANPGIKFFHSGFSTLTESTGMKTIHPLEDYSDEQLQVVRFFTSCWVHGNSFAAHRSIFEEIGPFSSKYRNAQDFEMWLRISAKHKLCYIPRHTCITRIHPEQPTSMFSEAGILDCAFASTDFINNHKFTDLFPYSNLNLPEHAQKAVVETLRIYLNPDSYIHFGGFNLALYNRFKEWYNHDCHPDIKPFILQLVQEITQIVKSSNIPSDIKTSFLKLTTNIDDCYFFYSPTDFLTDILTNANSVFAATNNFRRNVIYKYLSEHIFYKLGIDLIKHANYSGAKEAFELALGINPNYQPAKEKIYELNSGPNNSAKQDAFRTGRILFINPPYRRFLNMSNNTFPLTFGNMASLLEENGFEARIYDADYDIRLVDNNFNYEYTFSAQQMVKDGLENENHPVWAEIRDTITSYRPEIIGITAMSNKYPFVLKIAQIAKKISKDIKIVVGGHHATIFSTELIAEDNVDFVVSGEGEITFLELAQKLLRNDGDYRHIRGLTYKNGNNVLTNAVRPLINNLDDLPLSNRDLIINQRYISENNIITSRGCPFGCTYCSSEVIWHRKVRRRSVANVLKEVEYLINRSGSRHISFWDDSFTLNNEYTIEITNALSLIPGLSYSCITRLDLINEDILSQLRRSGCNTILFGIESGSDKILKLMNKKISKDFIRDKINMVKSAGIPWLGFFIMGFPGETRSDIINTLEFMKELDPNHAEINIFNPLPGTKIWDKLSKNNIVSHKIDFANHSQSSTNNLFIDMDLSEFRDLALFMAREFDKHNISKRRLVS